MDTEQVHTRPTDPRVPPLVRILRDGTEDQVLTAYYELIGANGYPYGHDLWDAAVHALYTGAEVD